MKSDTLKIDAAEVDTVFSFLPQQNFSCSSIHIYLIQHSTDTLFIEANYTVCENTTLQLAVADEWKNVLWKNAAQNQIGTGNSLSYQAKNADVITAFGNNARGCNLEQRETIAISNPVLVLNGDDFQILKGNSVSLLASGGISYEWTPATGLDRTDIPDPVASPTVTTRYSVTLTDSIGCTMQGSVLVEVSETAFIANLFTPNGDGKNDVLKIFGLTGARDFHFWVYNREGNVVFETKDFQVASSQGWNGNVNGTQQASGLYYWKVEGTDTSGQPVKLNGKKTGSALLLR